MTKTNYILSILFVALIAVGGFFAVINPAEACSSCSSYDYTYDYTYDDYYYDDYYYDDYYYDDYYYDDYYYDDYYYGGGSDWYFDFTYYQQPPTYYPPVYQPPVYNPPVVPTCSLAATQTSVTAGTPITLSWTAANAYSGTITNVGSVSPTYGTRTVTPQVTTTYVGTFAGQGGSTNCQTTVFVQPQTPPTCSLIATPGYINQGDSASLTWSSQNATSMTINNIGTVSTNGSQVVYPSGTTSYVATVSGQGGTATCQATVQVISQPHYNTPSCTLSITNYNNNQATIYWTTNNATSVNISNVGSVNTGSGSRTVYPGTGNTTYVATVTGQGGTATCQTTAHYTQSAPWCTLSVNQNSVSAGGPATLQWNSSNNTSSFYISGVGSVGGGYGSRIVYPSQTTTYSGTITNTNGQSSTCQTVVSVGTVAGVSLFQQPGDQPLAFVSLSQVPYTGFGAGPLLTFLFWFAVALWSFGLAYIFMGKRGIQFIAGRIFAFDTSLGAYQAVTDTVDYTTREDEYVNGHNESPTALSQMAVPEAAVDSVAVANSSTTGATTSLAEIIETRAHASGVLMSPEAVQDAVKIRDDSDEVLKIFGDILNEAISTLPREDGWILLSSDRFDDISAQYKTGAGNIDEPELSRDDLEV